MVEYCCGEAYLYNIRAKANSRVTHISYVVDRLKLNVEDLASGKVEGSKRLYAVLLLLGIGDRYLLGIEVLFILGLEDLPPGGGGGGGGGGGVDQDLWYEAERSVSRPSPWWVDPTDVV
ncbi:hypothetical protein PHYBLDRAFT_141255 [Phycomyces blakesleeanus NRRL 1555(-)]|uniref:Uncharacterized protein n=1 Tax=Phycomyces blakesleeanus (strain ATCC 8743b / DSM 1359 / FGSC 10004 / NBRC 33097 / NRRL 1555) TaxID=763407 RepID=A0A167P704_PHYB8|nr:hypothetical protein PHYBLDRAFT_141255 [Phycomyces blakesleeanus NRRL 1555(-)]OAD77371.1 hypothetical protein PHYBLDRAFT_141255 [Phycomyces blakesleeanus NRRL 1555(-)]|eukprot:XP_018295411.1 hypothetical protein PHYBLDRAFT_141255 [Phycomyces blakesleeanus NRRL 1555(-)]